MALLGIFGKATRNQHLLQEPEWMAGYLRKVCAAIGMTPVGDPIIERFPHWPGGAPSGIQFLDDGEHGPFTVTQHLAESAISMHTYPEEEALSILIDSCKEIPHPERVGAGLHDLFHLQVPIGGLLFKPGWSWQDLSEKPYMKEGWWRYLEGVT